MYAVDISGKNVKVSQKEIGDFIEQTIKKKKN